LSYGGYSPNVSDVDLALLFEALPPKPVDLLNRFKRRIADRTKVTRDRISLFWTTWDLIRAGPPIQVGRMPCADLVSLLRDGRLLFGSDRRRSVSAYDALHVRALLIDESVEFAERKVFTADSIAAHRRLAWLADHEPRRFVKLITYPLRLLFTARYGEVAGDIQAFDALHHDLDSDEVALCEAALEIRRLGKSLGLHMQDPEAALVKLIARVKSELYRCPENNCGT
jgi:hypothetical protein